MMKCDLKAQLDRDGYAILEGFLSDEEADILKKEGENLVKNMPEQSQRSVFDAVDVQHHKDRYFLDSADKICYFFDADALAKDGSLLVEPELALNKIGHALHSDNEVFKEFTFDERVKEVCYLLGYQEPAVAQSMYIFKNPGKCGLVIPHQDATYLYTEPQSLVGFWFALEDTTLENGCLRFAKGSHKSGIHQRFIRNPDTDSKDLLIYDSPTPYYQKNSLVPVPVTKGACVLIHGQVVHSSEENRTKQSRQIYTFHVIEQKDSKYSEQNWLQLSNGKTFLNVYKN